MPVPAASYEAIAEAVAEAMAKRPGLIAGL